MPPVLLAELGSDPQKATVCFYGHLDVQPARQEDGWLADPYALTEVDGKLYGRGATDNKGPVLAWINAVGAFRALQEVSGRRRPGGRVAPKLRAARPKPSAGCGLFLPPAVSGGVGDDHARLADEESEAWEGWGTCSQPPGWPGVVAVSP